MASLEEIKRRYERMSYDMEAKCAQIATGPSLGYRQTLRERLIEQKTMLERQLANVQEALDFMDKNPSFENFHNIVSKAGF